MSQTRSQVGRFNQAGKVYAVGLAAAFAILAGPAHAQFAGSPQFDASQVEIFDEGRVIVVKDDFAEITWTTQDTSSSDTIDFLPAQNGVAFWDQGEFGDYTVLNRITSLAGTAPDPRPIAFNGALASFVGEEIGGTVWFYSPNGVLIGEQAYFDVGNLLISTGDILSQADGTIAIRGAADGLPRIENRGLLNSKGYVALVAPRIAQTSTGQIRAGGAAALVAAESATLRISENLFDIEVEVGAAALTGDDVAIEHDGETVSSGLNGAGPHRIYMVALPKADALTLVLGGTIQALDATVEDDAIVISGGGNIVDGQIAPVSGTAPVDLAFVADTVGAFNPHVTTGSMVVDASGDIEIGNGASLQALGDLNIRAGGSIAAGTGSALLSTGDIEIEAGDDIALAGTVLVANGIADSRIEITAGDRIDVSTPDGSIRVVDQGGGLAGTIALAANTILISDDATRAKIGAALTVEEREALLEANGGVQDEAGSASAGRIHAQVSDALLVQNTGDSFAFAGLNAEQIAIVRAPETIPEVLVFGRSLDDAGTLITDFRLREFAVDLAEPFAPGSSINNCLLSLPSCFPVPPDATRPPITEIGDLISIAAPPVATLSVELTDVGALDPNALGLIRDPVSGTGDVGNWTVQVECLEQDREQCP